MKSRRLVIILVAFLLGAQTAVHAAAAEEEVEHHCFGLLWCTDREGDHIARDGFLWLYSSEERGPYSRLAIRPFYSEELDPTKDLLRRSVLWPLGTYERTRGTFSFRIVPFYWHGEEPGKRYTVIPPLYADYLHDDHRYTVLFPLYASRAQGDYYRQRFFLGPLFFTTEDTRFDLHRWDFLFPLGGHSSYADGADTWLAPVYFSGHEDSSGRNYRFLFPFYGHSESPGSHVRFLFPLFGSTQDETTQLSRFSLLGLPPLPTSRTFPAIALYEQVTAPDWTSHRFFPFYRYVSHGTLGTDLDLLLLYRHHTSAESMADRLFPLYNFEEDRERPARDLSLVGFRQWSVFHAVSNPAHWEHRMLGLYGYNHDVPNDSRALSMLGYGDLSLFWYHSTPSELAHRLFPLYRYRYDRAADETQFDALLVYRHLTTPSRTTDRLLPMWDYESARGTLDWRIGVLGLDPLVLIRHQSDDQTTANHVFPFYGYRRDGANRRFTALGLPPFSEKPALSLLEVADGPTRSAHRFTPVYAYAHDREKEETSMNALYLYWHTRTKQTEQQSLMPLGSLRTDDAAQTWGFTLLGLDPVVLASLVRHTVSPAETRSLLFPFYDYRREGSDLSFSLGGVSELSLFRYQTTPTMTRHRFFPLYDYRRDEREQSTALHVMLLYEDQSSQIQTSNRLFPLWHYDNHRDTGETRLGFVGWAPFSLYQAVTSPTQRSRRLFPVYAHRTDLSTGRGETDWLWPLLNVRSQDGKTTEWNALWWLAHYEQPTDESYEFRLFGGSKMALLRRAVSPERSSFDLNPVLPLFSYSAEHGKGISWNVFGGLVGAETEDQGQTRLRLFWFTI